MNVYITHHPGLIVIFINADLKNRFGDIVKIKVIFQVHDLKIIIITNTCHPFFNYHKTLRPPPLLLKIKGEIEIEGGTGLPTHLHIISILSGLNKSAY